MSQTYSCQDGDMLDAICQRYYGRTSGAVEAVLEANPGLAQLGPVYVATTKIVLPDLPTSPVKKTVRLWD